MNSAQAVRMVSRPGVGHMSHESQSQPKRGRLSWDQTSREPCLASLGIVS